MGKEEKEKTFFQIYRAPHMYPTKDQQQEKRKCIANTKYNIKIW